MKIPNDPARVTDEYLSLARIVSEDSQHRARRGTHHDKSSKDS